MFIIKKIEFVNDNEFIEFWAEQYSYPNMSFYTENIGKELTEKRVYELFAWKNGRNLSKKKRDSIALNYLSESDIPDEKATNEELIEYLNRDGGAIWRIFWLHCNFPEAYPIFDQHVYRAMAYIKSKKEIEIPAYNPKKVDIYVDEYISFYENFEGKEKKVVDEALWSFGKFLANDYQF